MKKPLCITAAFAVIFGLHTLGGWTPALAQGLDPMAAVGKRIFFDRNLSVNGTQSCADCHEPLTGFTGPDSDDNEILAVYEGAITNRYGNRKPPNAAYAGESPVLHYNPAYDNGTDTPGGWIGGMFWDGRATGERIGDPLAEQAMGPFLNPLEQAMPNARMVCLKVAHSDYAVQFVEAWGPGSLDYARDVNGVYERIARSVAAYERSPEVNPFNSKFDRFWRDAKAGGLNVAEITAAGIPGGMGAGGGMGGGDGGMGPGGGSGGGMGPGGGSGGGMGPGGGSQPIPDWQNYRGFGLSDDELMGLAIFNDPNRANCASCHTLTEGSEGYPLFTDFSYHNLGIPKNPDNPYYSMPAKWNPDGADWVDPGLGGYLQGAGYDFSIYDVEMGKFKTPTVRNVDLRPADDFVKAYGHNGFFKSLDAMDGIIHFYTWRAMKDLIDSGGGMGGGGMGQGGMEFNSNLFPAPELDANRTPMTIFNFLHDGPLIMKFLQTLSDDVPEPAVFAEKME